VVLPIYNERIRRILTSNKRTILLKTTRQHEWKRHSIMEYRELEKYSLLKGVSLLVTELGQLNQ
jgi:hypothetical protein